MCLRKSVCDLARERNGLQPGLDKAIKNPNDKLLLFPLSHIPSITISGGSSLIVRGFDFDLLAGLACELLEFEFECECEFDDTFM